jgi:hypothetical protein
MQRLAYFIGVVICLVSLAGMLGCNADMQNVASPLPPGTAPDGSTQGPGVAGYCPPIFPKCNTTALTDTDGVSCLRYLACETCRLQGINCGREGKYTLPQCGQITHNCQTNIPQD